MYVAGWNAPGYLPDTDEPLPEFDTFEEAVAYLVQQVDRHWDQDYEAQTTDATHTELPSNDNPVDARYLPVHTSLHNTGSTIPDDGTRTWSETTGDGRTVYFIQPGED